MLTKAVENEISPNTKRKLNKLASELNVKVEVIENPPFDIIDNTDDLEPSPADIIQTKIPPISPKRVVSNANDINKTNSNM